MSCFYRRLCYEDITIGDEDGIVVGPGSRRTTVSVARQRNGRRGQNVV